MDTATVIQNNKEQPVSKYTRDRINYLRSDISQLLFNFTNDTGLNVESIYVCMAKSYSDILYTCEVGLS